MKPEHYIQIPADKKVYFASDNHLGAPTTELSKPREKIFVEWLDTIKEDVGALFLMGDLFDFWFEYKTVVPKGFVRVLGKLAEFTDNGIPVYFFVGNHDLWMQDYFTTELNITVFHSPQIFYINNKTFFLAHGDGLGPEDKGYKRMKKVFTHPLSKWLFRWLHPDIGVKLGQYMSVKNKLISGDDDAKFLGEDKEWLIIYAKDKLNKKHYDYFVFGHRHLPMTINLNDNSKYLNLGDWIRYYTYAELDNSGELTLKNWQ